MIYDFIGWIKTAKQNPDRPRNQSPQEPPTKRSQILAYPKITVGLLILVKSWACSTSAIFNKKQLDGADSDTIHELAAAGGDGLLQKTSSGNARSGYEVPGSKSLFCPRGMSTHTTNTPLRRTGSSIAALRATTWRQG